jgi:hypothetical protein
VFSSSVPITFSDSMPITTCRQRLAEQAASVRAAVIVPQTATQAAIEVCEPESSG